MNGSERAVAPQPGIVAKIGIAEGALRAAAVAGRAIVAERRLAAGKGKAQQLWIVVDRSEIHCRDLIAIVRFGGLGLYNLFGQAFALAIAEKPLAIATDQRPSRHKQPIADGPYDRGVERPQPPFGQRLVQLGDAIPFVTGGFDVRRNTGIALSHRLVPSPGLDPSSEGFQHPSRSASCCLAKRRRSPRQRTARRRTEAPRLA